jgi:hypothetical protein
VNVAVAVAVAVAVGVNVAVAVAVAIGVAVEVGLGDAVGVGTGKLNFPMTECQNDKLLPVAYWLTCQKLVPSAGSTVVML